MVEIANIHVSTTGWKRLIFCRNETINRAAMVAANVAIMQGIKISVGFAAGGFTAALMAIILIGMSVKPEACKTRNINCALLACLLSRGERAWGQKRA